MKFPRIFVSRLQNLPPINDTVVVIDALRSFTTAAVALSRGARAVYPVAGVAAAITLLGTLKHSVSVGAVGGGDRCPDSISAIRLPAYCRKTWLASMWS